MPQDNIEEYKRRLQAQRADFKNCFGSESGRRVLQALREEFYDCRITPDQDVMFECGARHVIQQILERIEDE